MTLNFDVVCAFRSSVYLSLEFFFTSDSNVELSLDFLFTSRSSVSPTIVPDYELMSSPAPPSSVFDPDIALQVSQDPPMTQAPVSPHDSDPTLPEREFNRSFVIS